MHFTKPIIFCLLLSSCASYPPSSDKSWPAPADRIPASSINEENLAQSFETMMSSENSEKEFLSYLSRLKSIFARSEAYMADFDAELDDAATKSQEVNFENSKPYKKLLVMRDLSNRAQDKITYFYVKLTDISNDKGQAKSYRNKASKILKSFKVLLGSQNPLEKLSFEDLRTHIAHALKLRRGFGNKSLNESEVPTSSFASDNERVQMIRANRAAIQNAGRSESSKNESITDKVEIEADKIQLVDETGREPQSEKKFYPSVGTNGNIMGLIFPKGTWALTYDDGPNPGHTTAIVKNLEELGVNATFFWLAQNVVQYQSTVDLVKSKGHALANHSWSHAQLPKLSDAELDKEINRSKAVEEKAYGQPVNFFRCPYGAGNSVTRIRERIAGLGMIHVFWNVDTLDWQDKDPDSIVLRAKKQMQASQHGVVLFHDIHPQSVIASKKLVEWTKTLKGTPDEVRWVTMPAIVKEMNGE